MVQQPEFGNAWVDRVLIVLIALSTIFPIGVLFWVTLRLVGIISS
jgi:hypothetical protein